MLTREKLISLTQAVGDDWVLSVYVNGSTDDPSSAEASRIQLENSFRNIRQRLRDASHAERTAFDACFDLLSAEHRDFHNSPGARSRAVFITRNGVQLSVALRAHLPTMAVWASHPCIVPAAGALELNRPVVCLVGDSRKVDIYLYEDGTLSDVTSIRGLRDKETSAESDHVSISSAHGRAQGFSTHDAEQRANVHMTSQMVKESATVAHTLAGADGWILAGGSSHVAHELESALAPLAHNRILRLPSLDIHATAAEIAKAAANAASVLVDSAHSRALAYIMSTAPSDDLVAIGAVATFAALDQRRVGELFFTRRYTEEHLTEADDMVRSALGQHASLHEVSHAAADQLDANGGVAARLRYSRAASAEALEDVTSVSTV